MKTKTAIAYAALFMSAFAFTEEIITASNFEQMEARYNGEWSYPQEQLASNIYLHVKNIYRDSRSPFDSFVTVRGGGFCNEMEEEKILPLVSVVSNNCEAIADDWTMYETNEMVRFTTLCAIAYSGYDNYVEFADHMLSRHEADTNSCSWATVRFACLPYGTRLHDALEMHYETPVASNILTRLRALAIRHGDEALRNSCDLKLSGAAKREALELQAAGAL